MYDKDAIEFSDSVSTKPLKFVESTPLPQYEYTYTMFGRPSPTRLNEIDHKPTALYGTAPKKTPNKKNVETESSLLHGNMVTCRDRWVSEERKAYIPMSSIPANSTFIPYAKNTRNQSEYL